MITFLCKVAKKPGGKPMEHLASLIKQRNDLDREIAQMLGRPALPGHFGEFVAARIFNIALHESAAHKGSDGYFADGPLAGKTVNIKYYPKREGVLDMNRDNHPEFYLALTGPKSAAASSRGGHRPWVIERVYLFDTAALLGQLSVKIGTATSVRQNLWDAAEIYPYNASYFPLNEAQRNSLKLFSAEAVD